MNIASGKRVGTHSATLKRIGAGLSLILFPLMLLAGFATHPNLLSLAMVTEASDWISEWHGNDLFHIGHLLVMLAVPVIIAAALGIVSLLDEDGAWYGLAGGTLGIFGAVMLAIDKGALTFVLTAFKDMDTAQIAAITPALEAIFNRDGWLWITWAFVTLPLGFVILALGLMKAKVVPRWQGLSMIAGLLLLLNPDIEIISTAGAALMCVGFVPLGMREAFGRAAA